MSIYSTDRIYDSFSALRAFTESSLNHRAIILLEPVPGGGSRKETPHSSRDLLLSMPVCGLSLPIDQNGGSWKIPLEGSVIISGHGPTRSIHVTMEIRTPNELVSGESSPCLKRTP